MGVSEDTMQGLLEAIEMEHGNDYRKEVELKLQQDKGNFIKIDGHSDVIPTDINDNLIVAMDSFLIPPDDKWKEAIDKMNEVPNNYPYEDDRFSILGGYSKMGSKQLENVKKAWDDYYKDREEMRKAMFGEGEKAERRREPNMNERIAQFEKVSYEQFKKDMMDKFPVLNEDYIKKAYEEIIKLPIRKTSGSAGYDFVTPVNIAIKPHETFTVPTGIRCEMRFDYVLNIYVRSSIGFKYQTVLSNGTGIIDSDYYNADNEGHIMIKLINHSDKPVHINAGDAFAQGVFLQFGITNDDMADGIRIGGIGSTGKQ